MRGKEEAIAIANVGGVGEKGKVRGGRGEKGGGGGCIVGGLELAAGGESEGGERGLHFFHFLFDLYTFSKVEKETKMV